MSKALEDLGLRPDATERDVKRAYAKLLKETRPSEHPEGFQRLRESYNAAMQWIELRSQWDLTEYAAGDVSEPVRGEPTVVETARPEVEAEFAAAEPVCAAVNTPTVAGASEDGPLPPVSRDAAEPASQSVGVPPHELAQMVLVQASQCASAEDVQRWLEGQPLLWDLEVKGEVAQMLPWALSGYEEPLLADCLDCVWGFFDLDQVGGTQQREAVYFYQNKRHELSLRWLMKTDNQARLSLPQTRARLTSAWGPSLFADGNNHIILGNQLQWLSRPSGLATNVWRALMWGQVHQINRLLLQLSNYQRYPLAPPLDSNQIHFWARAIDSGRITKERLTVVFAQFLAVVLVVFTVVVVWRTLVNERGPFDWQFGAAVLLVGLAVPVYRGLWAPLQQWQGLPESKITRHAWLHLLCIPMFALVGLLLRGLGAANAGAVVWIWACWLMFHRFKQRQPPRALNIPQSFSWVLVGIAAVVGLPFLVFGAFLAMGHWVAVVLLGVWAFELVVSGPLAVSRRTKSSSAP